MSVIRKMESGEKRSNICSSFGWALATVSTIMGNTEKIKHSAQKTTKSRASNVSYTRNFNTEKMEQLLTLWVDNLNKKEFLSLNMLLLQWLGVFLMKINKEEVETRYSLLGKDDFQVSSNTRKFIA